MRSNKFASFVGFMLAGCAAENMRYQEAADTAYAQCVRASARTLALRSNDAADLVAAAAARSCRRELKAVEDSRALPLGAFEAAKFAEGVERDMAAQLVAEVVEARQAR
jgi:hypothetical protein